MTPSIIKGKLTGIAVGLEATASSLKNTSQAIAAVSPKAPGEIKVVASMGGDYGHNAIPLEIHIREIFASKNDWRIMFVRASRFFTPDLIADADLLITSRSSRPDGLRWNPDGLADTAGEGDIFWTDENADAIVSNVRNRGMGFLALHNTVACRKKQIMDMLDVVPVPHNEVQPLWIHDCNPEHPVTHGIGNIFLSLDEQFAVVIKSHSTTTLFETTAIHDKRNGIGGWCLEHEKGRVVGLLPGHMKETYTVPEYQEILWRAAHWAMKRDIPAFKRERTG